MAGANGRPYRHVHVHRPWAWCWWPATDLIRQDPDVTDARDPRTISTLDVDWPAVLQAVRYAVERCPVGPEALHLESVDVELPHAASKDRLRHGRQLGRCRHPGDLLGPRLNAGMGWVSQ